MAARSKLPPPVDGNVMGGACSPDPGLPTWYGYCPGWLFVVDDPPALLRKKSTPSPMMATPTTTTAMMPGFRPRLLGAILLREGVAIFCGVGIFCAGAIFFAGTGPFFPL